MELFNDVESKRSIESPIPVFASDDWDGFEEAPLHIYGTLEQPPYKGIGRRPRPILILYEDLCEELRYAQVCQKRGGSEGS